MRKLNDHVFISGQVQPMAVGAASNEGIDAVVCARPDGEVAGQPSSDDVRMAAQKEGLAFLYLPVVPGTVPSEEDARKLSDFRRDRKTLIYCAAGPRATVLNAVADAQDGRDVDDIIREVGELGIDLSPIRTVLTERSRSSAG
jgi:uncharacterized protein (TIGR01244 family)